MKTLCNLYQHQTKYYNMLLVEYLLQLLKRSLCYILKTIEQSLNCSILTFPPQLDPPYNRVSKKTLDPPTPSMHHVSQTTTLLTSPNHGFVSDFLWEEHKHQYWSNLAILCFLMTMLSLGVYSIFQFTAISTDKTTGELLISERRNVDLIQANSFSLFPSTSPSFRCSHSTSLSSATRHTSNSRNSLPNTLPTARFDNLSDLIPNYPSLIANSHFRPMLRRSTSSSSATTIGSAHSILNNSSTYTETTTGMNFEYDMVGNTATEMLMNLSRNLSIRHGMSHYVGNSDTIEEDMNENDSVG
ncbi:predicted protein [Lodderomyces elongisporus NRRL YB-4239]|uniref:Uncharacterized protein n=1 Tax=Lodderomyces elongisporus (strain ATCC 11503 / CBS 2605 / JCM 1781 / NBRC 1676 / NRRL YB-4239) TaxID=379508 RepID=A5E5T2_LODEL|nr:predicted protein [Lodderomyces elongisporus NRRL YB-4239]